MEGVEGVEGDGGVEWRTKSQKVANSVLEVIAQKWSRSSSREVRIRIPTFCCTLL